MYKAKEVLDEAKDIITGDRREAYGGVEDSFTEIASYWSSYLNQNIAPRDVCNLMILLKVARDSVGKGTKDNLVDIAGYAALAAEVSIPEYERSPAGELYGY